MEMKVDRNDADGNGEMELIELVAQWVLTAYFDTEEDAKRFADLARTKTALVRIQKWEEDCEVLPDCEDCEQ
jgi:hypothetical protein